MLMKMTTMMTMITTKQRNEQQTTALSTNLLLMMITLLNSVLFSKAILSHFRIIMYYSVTHENIYMKTIHVLLCVILFEFS